MTAPRPHRGARTRRSAALLVAGLAGLVSLAGCDPRTLFYFLQPWEPTVPAPGPKLDGKRVVIVTHALESARGAVPSLPSDINREVARLLSEKVDKIDVVNADKVSAWLDDHPNWTDPAEIARAFEADVVVFFEVETFWLHHPGDLGVYQGSAKTHIKATAMEHPKNSKGKLLKDKPKEPKTVYEETADTEFPVRGPIPVDSGVSESAFKNRFVKVVAAELSWHFVDHAVEDNIQDVKFNNR